MLNFPRLSSIFGMQVSAIDAAAIEDAITRNEVEDFDLDWKASGYPKEKNFELAKDVAAFANASGGVIILGVREDGGGAAIESTPIDFGTFPAERTTQVLASSLRPYLYGVEIRDIQTESGKGYQLIAIPRSLDAPHAVVDQAKGPGLLYPVRDGRTTRYLSEYEVAARYRNRYTAREETASKLEQAHIDGLSRIAIWVSPFLALSLVPTTPGQRGIGAAALAGEHGFFDRWEYVGEGAPRAMFARRFRVIPGIRRAIVTEVLHRGKSRGPHTELHYDGTGFAATNAMTQVRESRGPSDAPDEIQQDGLEIALFELLSMLGHHAADTGASGECVIRAQLHPSQQTGIGSPPNAMQLVEPVSDYYPPRELLKYAEIRDSLVTERASTHPTYASASLDELVSDVRSAAVTAHALATDIVAEFGISEPSVLRPDGAFRTGRLIAYIRDPYEPWADSLGLRSQD